jgi:hypothetical protein
VGIPLTDDDFVEALVHRLGCECFKGEGGHVRAF